MEQRELGRSGISVSRILLGCGNFGGVGSAPAFFGQGIPRDEAFRIMDAAWELGITAFDTADAYGGGRSETWIGEWLATKGSDVRDAIAIETKTFNPIEEGADRGLARARIPRQIDDEPRPARRRARRALPRSRLRPDVPQEETLARSTSSFARARSARSARPTSRPSSSPRRSSCPSSKASPATRSSELVLAPRARRRRDRLPVCREHGLGYEAFGPLAGGWLTGKYRRGEAYPEGSRMTQRPQTATALRERRRLRRARGLRARGARARRLDGRARARLAARASEVTAVVVGPTCAEHLEPVREALALELPADERDHLRGLFSVSRPLRARRARAPRHGVVHRGDGGGARVARARRALPARSASSAPSGRDGHLHRAHARVPRRHGPRVLAQGDRHHARQPGTRPRRTPGRRAAARRRDRRARRGPERVADHGDPHRRGLGGRHARARAARRAARRDPRRGRAGARRTSMRCAPCSTIPEIRVWARGLEAAERSRRGGRDRRAVRRRGALRRRGRARDLGQRAGRRAALARARRARQRRRLLLPDDPRARHGDRRGVVVLRRPPRVVPERRQATTSSRRRRARSGPSTSRPSSARCSPGCIPGREQRTSSRCSSRSGSRSRISRRPSSSSGRASEASGSRSTSDPARRHRARATASGARSSARRSSASTSTRRRRRSGSSSRTSSRSAPSSCAAPPTPSQRAALGARKGVVARAPGTWPRASPGWRASSASPRRSSSPTTPRRRSSPRSSAWADGSCAFHGSSGGPRWRRTRKAGDIEGFFVHPVRDPPVMAGNGTIGLELVEQLDDIDTVLIPWGGGGLTGDRECPPCAHPGRGRRLRARDGRARDRGARERRRARPGRVHAVVRDGAGSGGLLPRCGSTPSRSSRASHLVVTLDSAAATIRMLHADRRRGPPGLPSPPRSPTRAERAASSASSPAGTSTLPAAVSRPSPTRSHRPAFARARRRTRAAGSRVRVRASVEGTGRTPECTRAGRISSSIARTRRRTAPSGAGGTSVKSIAGPRLHSHPSR